MNDALIVLTVMCGPIAFFSFLFYALAAENEEDTWFFLRKRQFNKKLLQHGHETIWSFLNQLTLTTELDWRKKGSYIIYEPYAHTTVCFQYFEYMSDDSLMEIEIIEGTGIKEVFNLCRFDNSGTIAYGRDSTRKHTLTGKDGLRMKQMLFHLNDIWCLLRNEDIKVKKDSLQEEKITLLNTKKTRHDVAFEKEIEAEKNDERLLEQYFKDHLSTIYALLAELKQQEQWLSVESFHQINETFPNDLNGLSEAFQVIKDKEKVRADAESALQTIHQKLENFVEEVETNKHNVLIKRKLVIEKR